MSGKTTRERLQDLDSQYEETRQAWNATNDPDERQRLGATLNEIREQQIALMEDFDQYAERRNLTSNYRRLAKARFERTGRLPTPKIDRGEAASDRDIKRALEILDLSEIKPGKFEFAPPMRIHDLRRGKVTLAQGEVIALKTEVTRLRNLIRKALDTPDPYDKEGHRATWIALTNDPRLALTSREGGIFVKRLHEALRKGFSLRPDDVDSARLRLAALYNALRW